MKFEFWLVFLAIKLNEEKIFKPFTAVDFLLPSLLILICIKCDRWEMRQICTIRNECRYNFSLVRPKHAANIHRRQIISKNIILHCLLFTVYLQLPFWLCCIFLKYIIYISSSMRTFVSTISTHYEIYRFEQKIHDLTWIYYYYYSNWMKLRPK